MNSPCIRVLPQLPVHACMPGRGHQGQGVMVVKIAKAVGLKTLSRSGAP
jgi:hypothetical protein